MALRIGADLGSGVLKLWLEDGQGGRGSLVRGEPLFEAESVRLWRRSPLAEASGLFPDGAGAPWQDPAFRTWSPAALLGLRLRAAVAAAAPQIHAEDVRLAVTGAPDLSLLEKAELLLAARYAGFGETGFVEPWTALARGLGPAGDEGEVLLADLGHRSLRWAMVRLGREGLEVRDSAVMTGWGAQSLDAGAARAVAARLAAADQPDGLATLTDRLRAALADGDAGRTPPAGAGRANWIRLDDRWIDLPIGGHSLDLAYGQAVRTVALDERPQAPAGGRVMLCGLVTRRQAIARDLSKALDFAWPPLGADPFLAARGALASLSEEATPVSTRPATEGLGLMARGGDGALTVQPLMAAGVPAPAEVSQTVRVNRDDQTAMIFDLVSLAGGAENPAWRQRFGFRLGETRKAGAALDLKIAYEADDGLTLILRDPASRLVASQSRNLVSTLAEAAFSGEQSRLVAAAVIGRPGPDVLG